MALARAYGLDCDLVYQRQWRRSPVSLASIQDYLVSGSALGQHSLLQSDQSHWPTVTSTLQLRGVAEYNVHSTTFTTHSKKSVVRC